MQLDKSQFALEGTIPNTFPKEERLCSKKLIGQLFSKGSSFNLYPLRFVFLKAEKQEPQFPQVLISVSKKHFKHAVDRNRIKRQIREAYRLNKSQLLAKSGASVVVLGLIYIGKEKKEYSVIEKKLNLGLARLLNE